MYHILVHNGEYKWDLVMTIEDLDSALEFIRNEMISNGNQITLREV